MEESEIKKELNRQLKDFELFVKTATLFRDKEKEKFMVGLYVKDCIDTLRKVLPSLAQRGKAVSHRQDNILLIKITLVNLLDLHLALGLGGREAASTLRSQIYGQIYSKDKRTRKNKLQKAQGLGLSKARGNAQRKAGSHSAIDIIKSLNDAEKSPVKKHKKKPVKVRKKV